MLEVVEVDLTVVEEVQQDQEVVHQEKIIQVQVQQETV
jgi:hypothetical protein